MANLEPFPGPTEETEWKDWAVRVWNWFRTQEDPEQPVSVPRYTVSTLPRTIMQSGLIYVSDESGGAVLAFSDGLNWRRVTDRAIVS